MSDVLEMVAEIRGEVSAPDEAAVAAARAAFIAANVERPATRDFASSPKQPRFTLRRALPLFGAAGVIAAAALIVVLLTTGPATNVATAARVERIATIAERQARQIDSLDSGQYLLTRSQTVATIEFEFTQEKLDEISRRLAEAASRSHPEREFFEGTDSERIDAIRADESRRLAESSKHIPLHALPATEIDVSRRVGSATWINAEHEGGSSSLPGSSTEYGSPRQERAAEKLRAAGVPDGIAELKEATVAAESSRFDKFTWTAEQIRMLPADRRLLARRLRSEPIPFPLVRDDRTVKNDEELFHVAIGLLRSPFASPHLRAETMRMIGDIPGVLATPEAADARGHTGLGLALTTVSPRPQLVLDEDDSSVIGVNYMVDDPASAAGEDAVALPLAERARLGISFEPAIIVDGEPVCRETGENGKTYERFCMSQVRPVGE